ncbi:MAG: ribbon-helix-helix protein, CopG family [Rhodopila sp.]|jgi:hypothetical protein
MKSTGDNDTLMIPPALLAQVEAAAEEEHRTTADVVREALERYLSRSHRDIASRPAAKRTPVEAATRMREQRQGTFLPEGMTIRDLIDYGRA